MKILILISADAEWNVVKKLFPSENFQKSIFGEWFSFYSGSNEIIYFQGGWGKVSAAASAQYAIDHFSPELIINPGTCGGFANHIDIGKIILAEKTIIYDIVEKMGDAEGAVAFYSTNMDLSWDSNTLPINVQQGTLLSADMDINPEEIEKLISQYGAVAADWESGAIAWTAEKNGIRCLILRTVTDLVNELHGEAYKNLDLFIQRTEELMPLLIGQLEFWIKEVEK